MINYNFNKIDKLLQPLMTMMQEEFPINCKLIIEPYFARIVYEHDEMIFQSEEMKKPLEETFVGEGIKDFIQTMADVAKEKMQDYPPIDKTNLIRYEVRIGCRITANLCNSFYAPTVYLATVFLAYYSLKNNPPTVLGDFPFLLQIACNSFEPATVRKLLQI